jgi:hypothetical protein
MYWLINFSQYRFLFVCEIDFLIKIYQVLILLRGYFLLLINCVRV